MNEAASALAPVGGAALVAESTRLRGRRLLVARVVWVTLFALNLAWFGLALPLQVAAIQHPCAVATCPLTPAQAESFHQLGIGLGTVAAYYVGLPALSIFASLILALLLFWRRSDDWLALVVGLFLVYRVSSFAFGATDVNSTLVSALILPLALADNLIFYGVLLIFPDGRFVPRWAWLLLVAWAGQQLVSGIAQPGVAVPSWLEFAWGFTWPILYLSALAIQVYRFRRVSNARQRQQTKWVILGFAVALGANILYWIVLPLAIPPFLTPASLHVVTLRYPVVAWPLYQLATVALPVSFFVAIQRHQLFDVDVLIERTLVYGSLTLLLAAVYFGSVVALQHLASAVAGSLANGNPLIIVLSTLLIAALFTPLRRRLQQTIDRRFYRAKYDAAKTLERFAATLRTETNLSELSNQLVVAVRDTMQPASVSLWLRESGKTLMDERPVGSA
jgi:hypothetical protein